MLNLITKAFAVLTPDKSGSNLSTNIAVTSNNWTIGQILGLINTWFGIIAGAIAFIFLLVSGIMYVTANGNADQAKKAQTGIVNSIIGLVIIALAYGIFRAIITALGIES